MKTLQEYFDIIVAHLREQKIPAVIADMGTVGPRCRYRLVQGDRILKCAIGCLIPTDKYNSEMEEKGSIELNHLVQVAIEVSDSDMLKAFSKLQNIHDRTPPEEWEARFFEFANKHSLKYSKPLSPLV